MITRELCSEKKKTFMSTTVQLGPCPQGSVWFCSCCFSQPLGSCCTTAPTRKRGGEPPVIPEKQSMNTYSLGVSMWLPTSSKLTLWLFNIAMEHGPFIDGLPIKNLGSFHGYVSHNQMVMHFFWPMELLFSCLRPWRWTIDQSQTSPTPNNFT